MWVEYCVEWYDLEGNLEGGMYHDTLEEATESLANAFETGNFSKVIIVRLEHKMEE